MQRIWNVPAVPSVNKLMNSPEEKCSWILGIQDNSLSQITRQIPQLPVQQLEAESQLFLHIRLEMAAHQKTRQMEVFLAEMGW